MGTEYITSTVNNLFEKLDIASKNDMYPFSWTHIIY